MNDETRIMQSIKRFGKPIGPLIGHKTTFFRDNENLLANQRKMAALYASQPKRLSCMNCASPMFDAPSFVKLDVPYGICAICGHLNGGHVDTDGFCRAIYTDGAGASYAHNYSSIDTDAYSKRVEDIYGPKAEFLINCLQEAGELPRSLRYADLGAGAGYFLAALNDLGIKQANGFEVSESQIATAQYLRPDISITHHKIADIYDIARNIRADVVSMIGVLEHLQRPREMLDALRSNKSVRYTFISIPLLSLSVYIELAFPNVMQRHLSVAHTHLYTERSIRYFTSEFGFDIVGEWWFGTDMLDLHRSLTVSFGDAAGMLLPIIDQLQETLDRAYGSSEVHLLLRC